MSSYTRNGYILKIPLKIYRYPDGQILGKLPSNTLNANKLSTYLVHHKDSDERVYEMDFEIVKIYRLADTSAYKIIYTLCTI
jgi:hypothetical protein